MKNRNQNRKIPGLPDAELDIMLVLWQYDRPLKIIEIFNDLQPVRPCTKSAIHTLVESLHKRGFIDIAFSPDKRSYKMLTPLVTEEEYRMAETDSLIDKLCGGKWQKLIAALTASDRLSDDEIDELTRLLSDKTSSDQPSKESEGESPRGGGSRITKGE